MIRRFRVEGLNERMSFDLVLQDDLNIVTGKNGSGKTTLLKLMWFMLSGNVERILPEIRFRRAELETDSFRLELEQTEEESVRRLAWTFKPNDKDATTGRSSPPTSEKVNKLNRLIVSVSGRSLFFPTFRRIEGGFSMGRSGRAHRDFDGGVVFYEGPLNIEAALTGLSRDLSVREHRFVASISTNDIVSMLTSQYANISEKLNDDHRRLSNEIFAEMRGHESKMAVDAPESEKLQLAQTTLDRVSEQVRSHSQKQDDLLRPFSALGGLIAKIFRHKGIRVTSNVTLGDTKEAIESDKLSAGEKQMLSFLVYNSFESGSVIFIDEPEISLHVDWQRLLFPTLIEQGTRNQFIVATHSPFIFSRYADKELILDSDRGD